MVRAKHGQLRYKRKRTAEAFSSISRAAQADHARLTLRQMEARAADAEKALMGKGKLYSTLGVLAGFAAALMMI